MSRSIPGSTVLITGGTGSFGSTMVRRLLTGDVGTVKILSRDEAKQDDLRRALGDPRAKFYLGDVRDRDSVAEAMDGVDHVFHAAALKQVPSCEFFPAQAVRTNVQGSANVIDAAADAGAASVVCLSTDKAVYPVNAMGMTKALMEKTAQAFARNNPASGTVVSVVRYGNVMYSRGSVIPLFVEQALAGRPLTVTDPHMTRFLMSLAESVQLVEYAFEHASPGDLFVRKAPASTVADLAAAVSRLLGGEQAPVTIGTRHGEKLYETLLSREEMVYAQDRGDYYRVPLDARSLDYGLYFDEGDRRQIDQDDYTSHNTRRLDVEGTVELLHTLPEVQALLGGRAG
ncbi:UDP-glucose 4-epimerase [Jatrophihabitans endophyticus]|uniref:UDP-glucose 4-epimerase n=1 Tax=Jatrophihabitans endophyticus TaxID=1206085 RepID=A0A1M5IP04_9ACTN|nr:polysaccharide biosynthesis protein [Jatrophihabitans endophyticus]SHG30017.1 UDP-glucose 4-epimerase [Jatrophihabitans endophyticus]